jgi:hypothetical protein
MASIQKEDITNIYLEDLVYYKAETDSIITDLENKLQHNINQKTDKVDEGAPGGVATLNGTGRLKYAEIPYADSIEGLDPTNIDTIMHPKRTTEAIHAYSIPLADKGTVNGVATIDGNGKIPISQIPDLGSVSSYYVPTLTDMLALFGIHKGDRCIVHADPQSDNNGEYIAIIDNPTTVNDWGDVPSYNAVTSVNGRVGLVTITKADIPEVDTNTTAIAAVDNKTATNASDITAINGKLQAMAPSLDKRIVDGNLPTVDMVYGDSHQAVINVIQKSTGTLRAQFLYAADNLILRVKDDSGDTVGQMNLLPNGSMENPTAPKEPDSLATLLTAGMITPALDSKASIDYVNNAMLSIFTGDTVPPSTLGKTGDMYHQFATNTITIMKSGASVEDYSDTYTELYYDSTSTDIVAIGINPAKRTVYIDFGSNSSAHVSNIILKLNGVDIALAVKSQNNANIVCTYSAGFDSNIQSIVTGQPFELRAEELSNRELDYTKFNDTWYLTPVFNNTYDYVKEGIPNGGNPIIISTNVFQEVARLTVPARDAGTYGITFSVTFKYSSTDSSAIFQWSLDGGSTWKLIQKEVKDTSNVEVFTYSFPKELSAGPIDFVLQAKCEDDSKILEIDYANIICERKA